MSSPEKKRKKTTTTTTTEEPLLNPEPLISTPILPLPYDLVLSCIAHLSRLHYPSLSLVSKSCQTLLASPEIYKVRSFLNRTESCLYVCLQFPDEPNPNPRWFTLCRSPKKPIGGSLLVPITSPQTTHIRSCVVAVGSEIYEIGGLVDEVPSSNVSILDCRSNSWRKAPNMDVARYRPVAIVVDGKIHVKGGLEPGDLNGRKWVEVFDPKTQTWKIVPFTSGSKEWQSPKGAGMLWRVPPNCVIDSVLYSFRDGEFRWFDEKIRVWRIVNGLDELPKSLLARNNSCHVRLADYGGKMVLLWETRDRSSKSKESMISCAVIALERWSSEQIWGTVEWSDAVLKVTGCFSFLHVLAATV